MVWHDGQSCHFGVPCQLTRYVGPELEMPGVGVVEPRPSVSKIVHHHVRVIVFRVDYYGSVFTSDSGMNCGEFMEGSHYPFARDQVFDDVVQ